MSEWLQLTLGILLTFGTGVFVAAEFSLVALDRHDLERRREGGERHLDVIIRGLSKTSTHLSSAQLGITLTTLLAGFLFEPSISSYLSAPLTWAGVPEESQRLISVPVAVALATIFSMIVGELVPKNFAIAKPLATAKLVMPLQAGFTFVFRPAVVALNESANGLLRAIGIEPKEEISGSRSAEELASLVRHSASAGLLEADTATLLDRTLHFAELTAADVMTPRLRMVSIQRLESAADVLELSGRSGFSRFPVIDEDRDDVVGVVHVKQAVAVPRAKRAEVPVAALSEEPLRVPETMRVDQLLESLRAAGFQLAIVVDEYGGTAGLVTLEDLVEEIIGEVADEHDRAAAGVIGTPTEMTFPADLRPDELLEQTGINVPDEEEYDTVAGFVLRELGTIPSSGDEVQLDDGSTLRVERMDGRRIARLRFIAAARNPEDGASEQDNSLGRDA